jgi:glycosyltransferase involved in cell wall biosynthesis
MRVISFLFVDTERVWRGGQDQLFTLLRGLHQRGHDVSLVCHPQSLLQERAIGAGINVYPVAVRSEFGPIAFLKLARVLARVRPCILAFNTPRPILLGSLASRIFPVQARIIFRRVNFPLHKNPVTQIKYRWGIDCIIAISESIAQQLKAGGVPEERIKIIYEGIDLALYPAEDDASTLSPQTKLTVGAVAHLSPEKGLNHLVDAAALIPRVRERMRFVIVGDGECRPELEAQVKARGLEGCFEFAGFQNRPAQYVKSFDIFVLPSLSEGLSSAILTAMASSLPVVATKVGGIPELISNEQNGILVPPADAAALARAIERLADEPARRREMGRAGRVRMEGRFTLERKIIETEQVCAALSASQAVEWPADA